MKFWDVPVEHKAFSFSIFSVFVVNEPRYASQLAVTGVGFFHAAEKLRMRHQLLLIFPLRSAQLPIRT